MSRQWVTAWATVVLVVLGAWIAASPQASDPSTFDGLFDSAGGSARSPGTVLRSGSLGQAFSGVPMSSGRYRVTSGVILRLSPNEPALAGDFDGDRSVDFSDFVIFASGFGKQQGHTGFDARLDLDGDRIVGFGDFVIFAKAFGARG